ncbi:MAG: PAS domain S-box protein [Rhodocyclaceae bacterium]|nr:PAS domain S-box protein [Rhodocyclaceae bacterium]
MRLRAKLILPFLLAYGLLLALTHLFWLPAALEHERKNFMQAQSINLRTLEPDLARSLLAGDLGALYGTLDRQREIQGNAWRRIDVVGADGLRLYPLLPPAADEQPTTAFEHMEHRIAWEGDSLADIRVQVDWSQKREDHVRFLYLLEALIFVLFGLVIAGAAAWQQRLVRLPVLRLAEASSRVAVGDFSAPLPPPSNDEVGDMTRAFDGMRTALLQAHEQLRESKDRYRLLLQHSPVGIFHYDTDLVISYCNDRFARILRAPRDKLIGFDMHQLADQRVLPALRAALDGQGGFYEGEYRTTQSQVQIGVTLICEPFRDAAGKVTGGIGIVADITERKLAEDALRHSEQKLRMLLDNAADAVFIASPEEIWTYANEQAAALLGYSREDLIGMTIYDLVPPSYRDRYRQEFAKLSRCDKVWARELRLIRKDGSRIPVEMNAVQLPDGGIYGSCRDITERQKAEEELRIAAIAFETQEGMMVTDSAGRILRVNHAFTKLTGYSAAEAIGNTPAMLKSGRQDEGFYRKIWATLLEGKYWEGEVWNRRKTGEIYPEWLTITAVSRPGGRITHYVGIFSDITERKAAEEQIHSLAFYDPLTNLPNRRLLYDRCEQALRACARRRNHGAVLFLDLDRFKTLNDTQGHDVGDLLLIEVARRLLASVRAEDTVARMGGDEFVVLLEELSPEAPVAREQARDVAEKIRAAIDAPYSLKGLTHNSSPSIGICLFDSHEASVNELLMHADQAMYQAKAAGRNTVRVFGD